MTAKLTGAEERPGQVEMARAVDAVLRSGGTLLVEAGTGTGKSLAYLVPALLSRRRPVVVATATKALQDQLLGKDVLDLAAGLGRPVKAISVKGRASYLCRAKEAEVRAGLAPALVPGLDRLLLWADATTTGDMAELDPAPAPGTWAELSVSGMECPGSSKCPYGEVCLPETARADAEDADIVVVNHAVLAIDLAIRADGGVGLLPEPAAIVIDEAHRFEESLSSALGQDIAMGRVRYAAGQARSLLADRDAPSELEAAGAAFFEELAEYRGSRIDATTREAVLPAAVRLNQAVAALSAQTKKVPDTAADRRLRLQNVLSHFAGDLYAALEDSGESVAWVEPDGAEARLRAAPLEVAPFATEALFSRSGEVPVILTSATLAFGGSFLHLRSRLGIEEKARELRVESPFDFRNQALLYCAAHLPDPRSPGFDEAAREEIRRLLDASGGRAFCLFTSWRAMNAAYEEIAGDVPWNVLRQGDAGPARLIQRFREECPSVLFATVSFWQGVDVPGDELRLVVLDKLPFASPGDPLSAARVEAVRSAGGHWFDDEVLPRAGLLLAQGVGRLIRRRDDRGVVAVLDRRLATATYRKALLDTLPPLRRTASFDDARAFLSS